jgi:3-hydroxyisobutyrate dehydrogenase
MTTVAVLGTGVMGAPMARNLAKAGFTVRVWNRTHEKAEALVADGVTVAADPAAAVQDADVVVTMLLDGDAVSSAMTEALPSMRADALWLQMATVGVEAIQHLEQLAAAHGVTFVDAPVLGTKQPAEQGELVVLAAGPNAARDRAQPVFEAVGRTTKWVGAAGAATRLKLVLNSWVIALTTAMAEAVALAQGLGVDPQQFFDTIDGGPLDNAYARMKARLMLDGEFPASFPLEGAAKDAGLIVEAAASAGVRAEIADAVRRQMGRATDLGHGREDMAAVWFAASADAD